MKRGKLRRDMAGATIVEFALILPVFITLFCGILEFSYELYLRNLLDGAMSKAARDLTLESAADAAVRTELDSRVTELLRTINTNIDVTIERKGYHSYGRIKNPAEPFADTNLNGVCDAGESFEDSNGNGRYDRDGGQNGWGGADDAVVYTARVRFERLFPVAGLVGIDNEAELTNSRMLRIQPYAPRYRPRYVTCR